jgi:hypothetical protein
VLFDQLVIRINLTKCSDVFMYTSGTQHSNIVCNRKSCSIHHRNYSQTPVYAEIDECIKTAGTTFVPFVLDLELSGCFVCVHGQSSTAESQRSSNESIHYVSDETRSAL